MIEKKNINLEKDRLNVINQFTTIITECKTSSGIINNEKKQRITKKI